MVRKLLWRYCCSLNFTLVIVYITHIITFTVIITITNQIYGTRREESVNDLFLRIVIKIEFYDHSFVTC